MVKVSLSANRMSFVNPFASGAPAVSKSVVNQCSWGSVGAIASTSVSPTPNSLQFAAFAFPTAPTAVTGNGLTWTQLGIYTTNSIQVGIWYAYSGNSPTAGGTGESGHGGGMSSGQRWEALGVNGTIRQTKVGSSAFSATGSLTFDANVVTGNMIVGMLVTGFGDTVAHTFTAPMVSGSPPQTHYLYSAALPWWKVAASPTDTSVAWTGRTAGGSYIPVLLELAA